MEGNSNFGDENVRPADVDYHFHPTWGILLFGVRKFPDKGKKQTMSQIMRFSCKLVKVQQTMHRIDNGAGYNIS
jgi:hypothetical protein